MTASAATTQAHIAKYAPDNITILNETTITYQWMESNLPVLGDGVIQYYLQGPVFADDPDPAHEEQLRWNSAEDKNVQEKDMGAVKGTDLKNLCDLAGGMNPGDTVKIKAADGFSKTFAYENVYTPLPRQGPMVIAWYTSGEGYVPQYRSGMRLIFLADNSTNPWGIHALGNNDWRVSASQGDWYYYRQGDEKYPTTTGLSVQYVSDILIYSRSAPVGETAISKATIPAPAASKSGISLLTIGCSLAVFGAWKYRTRTRE